MPGDKFKQILGGSLIALVVLMIFGFFWAFLGQSDIAGLTSGGLGWYLFSYAMGLTMIVLPCTLPLAFVIVPMVLKKGAGKGFGLALSFGLGVAITLSLYGLVAAIIGKTAIAGLQTPLETVKNWVYFIAGIFAYLFALSEVGLLKFHMPTYKGAAPAFIQKQGDYLKALLLGLFLGNIGVGCPHPATPLILTEIASSGDLFYGWSLFLVHALGRVIPLLILALLAILGVSALSWLVAKKDKLERATGWAMVFVAGFILTLGLFTHAWWTASGQHTLFESILQEERWTNLIAGRLSVPNVHQHGLEEIAGRTGLFGLPLGLGNWFLVFLWVLPLWWYYKQKRQEFMEKNLLRSRFWTYFILTLLLVVTFVYYLPARFLLQAQMPHGDEIADDGHGAMMNAAGHSEAVYREANEVTAGLAVGLSPLATSTVGLPTELRFFVSDKPSDSPVPNYALEIEHEKLMHVIGVRDDLEEFFHVHPLPTITPGVFAVTHTFNAPGNYKIWSEIKQGGVVHAFGHQPFRVSGAGSTTTANSPPRDFPRSLEVRGYKVSLNLAEPVLAGHEHELSFSVRYSDGRPAMLDNYLGALMHLAVIKNDWSQFLHTHPEDSVQSHAAAPLELIPRALANGGGHGGGESVVAAGQDGVNFQVNLLAPGLYRAFAQFRPAAANLAADDYLLAAFWIEVKDGNQTVVKDGEETAGSRTLAGTWSGVWWTRLIVSLIAIVILSLLVKRLIKV